MKSTLFPLAILALLGLLTVTGVVSTQPRSLIQSRYPASVILAKEVVVEKTSQDLNKAPQAPVPDDRASSRDRDKCAVRGGCRTHDMLI